MFRRWPNGVIMPVTPEGSPRRSPRLVQARLEGGNQISWRVDVASREMAEAGLEAFTMAVGAFSSLLVCFETVEGGNPHLHGLMESVRNDAFVRRELKKAFDVVESSDYSVTNPNARGGTWQKGLQYICKGPSADEQPDILRNVGGHNVVALHDRYWAIHAAVGEARVHVASRKPMLEQLRELYEQEKPADMYIWCRCAARYYKELPCSVNAFNYMDAVKKVAVEQYSAAEDVFVEQLIKKVSGV